MTEDKRLKKVKRPKWHLLNGVILTVSQMDQIRNKMVAKGPKVKQNGNYNDQNCN